MEEWADVGGCGGKIGPDALCRILSAANRGPTDIAQFRDSETIALSEATGRLVTSVDLVYDLGLDGWDLGFVAVVHGLSDLYAALARPVSASLAVGLRRSSVDGPRAGEILSGARAALHEADVAFGGGHSVYAGTDFVSVAAVGSSESSLRFDQRCRKKYEILLSKPLGSGVLLAALKTGVLEPDVTELLRGHLRASNRLAADELCDVGARDEIAFVTDVSGFGLGISILSNVCSGWTAHIDCGHLPLIAGVKDTLHQGIVTVLGDQNLMVLQESSSCHVNDVSIEDLVLAADPQTSGGLLAAVGTGCAESLIKSGRWTWIGALRPASDLGTRLVLVN